MNRLTEGESREGIVKDIILKSAEGLKEGLICHGNWMKWDYESEDKPDNKVIKAYGYALDESEFWHLMKDDTVELWEEEHDAFGYVKGHKSFTFTANDRAKLMEDAINSQRCAEGELMWNTALLGGTSDDYNKAKDVVLRHLENNPLPLVGDGFDCQKSIDDPSMCTMGTIAHWNDGHMVPSWRSPRRDDAIEIGGHMSEVFRAAADRL